MSRFFASQGSSSSESEGSDHEERFSGSAPAKQPQFVQPKRQGLFEALADSESEQSDNHSEFTDGEGSGYDVSEGESAAALPTGPVRKSRFAFASDSDEESEEESTQRQVKSQRDKVYEEMVALADAIKEASRAGEWVELQTDFDKLMKLMTKHQKFGLPRTALLVVPALESRMSEVASGSELKKMNAIPAKAFNAVRQKLRKASGLLAENIKMAQAAHSDEEFDDGASMADSTPSAGAAANRADTMAGLAAISTAARELTPETILKRLQEIISQRGRKHVDKMEHIALLRKILSISKSRRHSIHALLPLIATQFETCGSNLGYASVDVWKSLLTDIRVMFQLLEEEELSAAGRAIVEHLPEEEDVGLPPMNGVRGSLISYVQRLDDEFTKALQNIDPHAKEYLEFLRVEPQLYSLLSVCRLKLLRTPNGQHGEFVCQLLNRQLEHIYYKSSDIVSKHFDSCSSAAVVVEHCRYMYANAPERLKARALLYQIYWLCIHDQYQQARELILQSHIQDAIGTLEVSTQILYNRTLVQYGMAAFRRGLFKETYFALQELCSTGRPKELLAQGLVGQKFSERSEMDRHERARLVPFHMHLNVELIDCVFLTVSMILEIPQSAAASRRFFTGERRLYQSRHLRRIIDGYDRNLFNGPPENTREAIIVAAKALANGRWFQCEQLILGIGLWDQLKEPDTIRALLRRKIREAGLYSFIYSVGSKYSTLSLACLAKEYDLPVSMVLRVLGHLIAEFGLPAGLTADNSHLQWKSEDPTVVQELIMQLNDKLRVLDERNGETSELLDALHHAQLRSQREYREPRDRPERIAYQSPATADPSISV